MTAKEILIFMASKDDLLCAYNLRRNNGLLFTRSLSHNKDDLPLGIALCEDIDANCLIQSIKDKK